MNARIREKLDCFGECKIGESATKGLYGTIRNKNNWRDMLRSYIHRERRQKLREHFDKKLNGDV